MHAPRSKYVGDAGKLWNEVRVEDAQIGIDVIHAAAVDADRGQQSRVFGGSREIGADAPVVEENGASAIAALDTAIEIIPLVHPAHGRRRVLQVV